MVNRRTEVVRRDGVLLAEALPRDLELLAAGADGLFDVDPDPRPLPFTSIGGKLVVLGEDSGELLGDVGWVGIPHGPTVPCLAINIGITLLPAARGRGVGAVAQRLLAEYLFATTEAFRIEASTDVANVAEQKSLRRAGFRRDGLVRGGQLRGGVRRDLVLFSLLRSELAAPNGPRSVVAQRDGVVLAESRRGDRELVAAASDGAFAIQSDDRVSPVMPPVVYDLAVTTPALDELLGLVSWHALDYGGTLGCAAWNIGIEIVPAARGRGVGAIAQRLLAEHLFATSEVDRVEAGTDVANIAEQKALEKAGFQREGVLRGVQLRGGTRHDMVMYGMLRSDL